MSSNVECQPKANNVKNIVLFQTVNNLEPDSFTSYIKACLENKLDITFNKKEFNSY